MYSKYLFLPKPHSSKKQIPPLKSPSESALSCSTIFYNISRYYSTFFIAREGQRAASLAHFSHSRVLEYPHYTYTDATARIYHPPSSYRRTRSSGKEFDPLSPPSSLPMKKRRNRMTRVGPEFITRSKKERKKMHAQPRAKIMRILGGLDIAYCARVRKK